MQSKNLTNIKGLQIDTDFLEVSPSTSIKQYYNHSIHNNNQDYDYDYDSNLNQNKFGAVTVESRYNVYQFQLSEKYLTKNNSQQYQHSRQHLSQKQAQSKISKLSKASKKTSKKEISIKNTAIFTIENTIKTLILKQMFAGWSKIKNFGLQKQNNIQMQMQMDRDYKYNLNDKNFENLNENQNFLSETKIIQDIPYRRMENTEYENQYRQSSSSHYQPKIYSTAIKAGIYENKNSNPNYNQNQYYNNNNKASSNNYQEKQNLYQANYQLKNNSNINYMRKIQQYQNQSSQIQNIKLYLNSPKSFQNPIGIVNNSINKNQQNKIISNNNNSLYSLTQYNSIYSSSSNAQKQYKNIQKYQQSYIINSKNYINDQSIKINQLKQHFNKYSSRKYLEQDTNGNNGKDKNNQNVNINFNTQNNNINIQNNNNQIRLNLHINQLKQINKAYSIHQNQIRSNTSKSQCKTKDKYKDKNKNKDKGKGKSKYYNNYNQNLHNNNISHSIHDTRKHQSLSLKSYDALSQSRALILQQIVQKLRRQSNRNLNSVILDSFYKSRYYDSIDQLNYNLSLSHQRDQLLKSLKQSKNIKKSPRYKLQEQDIQQDNFQTNQDQNYRYHQHTQQFENKINHKLNRLQKLMNNIKKQHQKIQGSKVIQRKKMKFSNQGRKNRFINNNNNSNQQEEYENQFDSSQKHYFQQLEQLKKQLNQVKMANTNIWNYAKNVQSLRQRDKIQNMRILTQTIQNQRKRSKSSRSQANSLTYYNNNFNDDNKSNNRINLKNQHVSNLYGVNINNKTTTTQSNPITARGIQINKTNINYYQDLNQQKRQRYSRYQQQLPYSSNIYHHNHNINIRPINPIVINQRPSSYLPSQKNIQNINNLKNVRPLSQPNYIPTITSNQNLQDKTFVAKQRKLSPIFRIQTNNTNQQTTINHTRNNSGQDLNKSKRGNSIPIFFNNNRDSYNHQRNCNIQNDYNNNSRQSVDLFQIPNQQQVNSKAIFVQNKNQKLLTPIKNSTYTIINQNKSFMNKGVNLISFNNQDYQKVDGINKISKIDFGNNTFKQNNIVIPNAPIENFSSFAHVSEVSSKTLLKDGSQKSCNFWPFQLKFNKNQALNSNANTHTHINNSNALYYNNNYI